VKEEKVIQVHRTIRRLNQTEAVVLPTNQSAPIASVNVQFGSLTISTGEESIEVDEKEDEKTREVESKDEVVTQTVTEQVPQQKEEPPQPEISLPQQQQLQTPQPQPQPQPQQQLPSFQSVAQPSLVQAAQHVAPQANTQPPLPVNQLHPLQQQQQTPLPMAGLVGLNYPLQQTQQQPVADSYINPYYVPHTAAGYTGGEYNTVYSNDTQRMVKWLSCVCMCL
jgi:outer membrane biosynthesis protein TonB